MTASYLKAKKMPHTLGKKHKLRLKPEEIKEINRLWSEGYTVPLIVKIMKRSPTTVEKAIGVRV